MSTNFVENANPVIVNFEENRFDVHIDQNIYIFGFRVINNIVHHFCQAVLADFVNIGRHAAK